MSSRLEDALACIDAYNAKDPKGEQLLYSERMSAWLEKLEPEASDALRITARAQHIGRWTSPRETFPMTRPGYKKWREELAAFHADTTAEILRDVGYGDDVIERVFLLIKKKNLKTDPECQTLEDVICLVFLQFEFEAFAAKHDDDKLIRILQRTWLKMSDRGHDAALALELPPHLRSLVERALAG